MRKRKYEYTIKQEREILEAANYAIGLAYVIAGIIMVFVSMYVYITQFVIAVIGTIIVAITTFIFLNYRAWIVVSHRNNVKSQDDNIEKGQS